MADPSACGAVILAARAGTARAAAGRSRTEASRPPPGAAAKVATAEWYYLDTRPFERSEDSEEAQWWDARP